MNEERRPAEAIKIKNPRKKLWSALDYIIGSFREYNTCSEEIDFGVEGKASHCPHKSIPESFFEQRSQRSLREHSHRSKGKQTRERLRILQKNGMRIHYNDAQKT